MPRKSDNQKTIDLLREALLASRHECAQLRHENAHLKRTIELFVAALPKVTS
jgi:hypothetical protein